ncbi:flagellar biosynthetic protein FliO [Heliobacterium chlorum]|uniref:Flagellar biosynthetic protein FliO n=1 Tax=Heliobacterium chlorum TaxID=2698 RepID=A0ABR7T012_HELCL|nr:flagellar biosynthetic protein FliO [Heliobacterium chlorum]MBC9783427.1 flagellar biosynthetic protein FliO [Heliobacterium chlorum]
MNVYRRIGRRMLGGLAFFGLLFALLSTPYLALADDANNGDIQHKEYGPQSVAASDKSGTMPGTGDLLLRLFLTLVVLGGVGWGVVRFWKRSFQVPSRGNWLAVLDQVSLGPNKNIYVTEIAGKVFVIGATDHAIQPIMEITDENMIDSIRQSQTEAQQKSLLEEVLGLIKKTTGKERSEASEQSFHLEMMQQIDKLNRLRREQFPNQDGNREGENRL